MEFKNVDILDELKRVLEELDYKEATEIQALTYSLISSNKDILGEAPTGTGKTFAYAIPLLNRINTYIEEVQCIVIVPTRELAIQSTNEIKKLSKYIEYFSCCSVYGGQQIRTQIKELKKKPLMVVGTPGRILDLIDRRVLKLGNVKHVVLDECDEMLNMGFRQDIDSILSNIKGEHQTVLFSATINDTIRQISNEYQNEAISIKTERDLNKFKNIEQYYLNYKLEENKLDDLISLLSINNFLSTFVFVRTKRKVEKVARYLKQKGFKVAYIHGDLKQNKRDDSMKAFREKKVDILVATDIAARGLDVYDCDAVINYDLPENDEYYIHRIGRTGRAKNIGMSFTFVSKRNKSFLNMYEKMTNDKIYEYQIEHLKGNINYMKAKKYLENIKDSLQESNKEYEDLILELLNEWKKDDEKLDVVTIAAALLKKGVNLSNEDISLDSQDRPVNRNSNKKEIVSRRDANSTRYFMNIGTRDGADEKSIKHFLLKYIENLKEEEIVDVYILESYLFFQIKNTYVGEVIEPLNNESFSKRKVNVEISSLKTRDSKRDGNRSFNKDSRSRNFSSSRGERSFKAPKRNFSSFKEGSSDKPKREYKKSYEPSKSFSEKKTYSKKKY